MNPQRNIRLQARVAQVGAVLAILTLALLATAPAASAAPDACSTPRTRTIRGVQVVFDQCYQRPFTHDGTNYEVDVYYTETNSATNLSQCPALNNTPSNDPDDGDNDGNNDGIVDRCEHALPNNDDGNGDNVEAVGIGAEMETAMRFYVDRNLEFLPGGGTVMNVYIAEDPRIGGIINGDGIYTDDDWMVGDQLAKRLLAFHEGQHLVQTQYDDNIGWDDFYGEGIARAIEDRVDNTLDADLGHLFIPEVNGILGNDGNRASDITTVNYRSVLWWTWLMDRYSAGSDVDPVVGWQALRDFYLELKTESDDWKAAKDFISSEGGSPVNDFIDYTLALWAHKFNPGDARLSFLDSEIRNNANSMSGHTVVNGGPAFSTMNQAMNPRSSRYWEFNPASQCDFIAFTFDGQGDKYGFSVMTADSGSLQDRWTSYSNDWARTVRTANYDRVIGVVTAFDSAGQAQVGFGCVTPTLTIKSPTTAAFAMVGNADNPRKFIVRVDVDGEDGSGVAGLTASDFAVTLQKSGESAIPASIVSAVYVQDDYWLLVQAPSDADGAQTGQFYNLTVALDSISDTNNSSVLYIERTQDVVISLDRSGSMGGSTGKIEAARNAANLLTTELSEDDQGGYVAFDDNAFLRESLAPMTDGHRTNMTNKIAGESPGGATSIGDGMLLAAQEHDANKDTDNVCSFVLLSDGHENTAAFWGDIKEQVIDNECPIHAIALGPGANEVLLQQISAAVPGGSYDYATTSGSVPINAAATVNAAAVNATPLGWENNLSRIYDAKMARIAGRQRIYSAVGQSEVGKGDYRFFVDDATDTLVLSTAWQVPFTGEFSPQFTQLFDPDGNPVDPGRMRKGINGTSEVWTVPGPQSGFWSLRVTELFVEYYVSATALTDYELYLLIGTPIQEMIQTVEVPIYGVLVGPNGPLTGANVVAEVQRPNGMVDTLVLKDDGAHGDVEADDGIYAALYTITGLADQVPPKEVVENEEPQTVGSYQVTLRSVYEQMVREAQDSFALAQDEDSDADGMPDGYEKKNGLDPEDPTDAREDADGDRLPNVCECQYGTDMHNPDTDDGGEADGSEVPSTIDEFNQCRPTVRVTRNPLDPDDDRGGKIGVLQIHPELTATAIPFIHVFWSLPDSGQLRSVEIWRRLLKEGEPGGDWELIAEAATGQDYDDEDVEEGMMYQYRLVPTIVVDGAPSLGEVVESNGATVKNDPYAPTGSVIINDGDAVTNSTLVTLWITGDDSGDSHNEEENPADTGTPVNELEMMLSNRADFAGADWQPFMPLVEGWDLGDVASGETATVYVQFRDNAGNVGESGFAQMDTILYEQGEDPQNTVFLPYVLNR